MTVELLHGPRRLILERLRAGSGMPLLLLHALFGSRRDWEPDTLPWAGAVWALDLGGHGDSEWIESSAYAPELFAADADVALAHLGGSACVAGRGAGGYAALLLAGARPAAVPGVAVLPGAGLDGGGELPEGEMSMRRLPARGNPGRDPFDPRVMLLERDPRPAEYTASFAQRATLVVLLQ